jgi:predicted ribosome quality control (RQC) complex YloA/Tae2 family protein
MNKKNLSSLELAALVNELQFLVRGKISQIYQQEKKELLFQLHAPGEGKQLLKIFPGKILHLTSVKEGTPLKPPSFSMQLRKYIGNATIKAIFQKDAERILIFELEKEKKYSLVIELFSKGNIVLLDAEGKIISVLERQKWKDRTVKPGEKYIFPSSYNWKELSEKGLKTILNGSEKKNLATALATEVGLGGVYAEETCFRAEVEKSKLPGEVSGEEVAQIVKVVKEFLKLIQKPAGFIYEDQITPFALSSGKVKGRRESYHEAIATLKVYTIVSPYEKKIENLKRMIQGQEEAIEKLREKIIVNKEKGEKVYENYPKLEKLLQIVAEMKKTKEWSTIGKELRKEKKIKEVNLKEKKIKIEL